MLWENYIHLAIPAEIQGVPTITIRGSLYGTGIIYVVERQPERYNIFLQRWFHHSIAIDCEFSKSSFNSKSTTLVFTATIERS
jgi:hypothetical protein